MALEARAERAAPPRAIAARETRCRRARAGVSQVSRAGPPAARRGPGGSAPGQAAACWGVAGPEGAGRLGFRIHK